eukprot:TRINITY_DN61208_c0_g1_i1.p1 TRINITY_DN61208_c0_g1~~TRINITY_DN61208_c0_g1_i1.p1  ORF type:complete len:190 (+),score=33.36 TRINITY_DN61208_c0_g1_i1:55-570(+)
MAENLAPGWAAYQTDDGSTYYANVETGETSWEPPVAASSGPALPPGWTAHEDPGSGQTYYANLETGETSWEVPGGGAAAPAVPAEPTGTWSVDHTYTLGAPGSCEHMWEGKGVQLLDPNLYNSVSSVAKGLNANDPFVEEGFCVVFSSSKQQYFLLWRSDCEATAFATLGI